MARSEIIHSITYDRNPILAVSGKFTSSITTDNFITIHTAGITNEDAQKMTKIARSRGQ